MGVASNQARLMTLTSRQHDLEVRAQSISAEKMIMAMKSEAVALQYTNALNSAADATAASSAMIAYTGSLAAISREEKALDLELAQINTEHEAVKTEYDSVKSLISDNTDKSFNIFG